MATITQLTKNLIIYSNSGSEYLHVEQDDNVSTQLNFLVKNASDSSNNDTIKPYFRNLTFKEGTNTTTNLATRLAALDTSIATNATNISANAASLATNSTNIATNSTAISTEAGARAAGDASLQAQIDAANSAVGASIATLESDLVSEQNARIAADSTLQTAIDGEQTARIAAVSNEATLRSEADTALSNSIDGNSAAITSLQTNMTAILNMSTTDLDSFAEVATKITELGVPAILSRLDAIEAAISALQGN
jgi:trimeric autotransporter adhesin